MSKGTGGRIMELLKRWPGHRPSDRGLVVNLQQALKLSLRCSAHFPRLAERVSQYNPDPELRAQLLEWGTEQVNCSDEIASLITDLGAEPFWVVDCHLDEMESPDFFFMEAARQSRSVALLRETARLASNDGLRQVVNELADSEEKHLKALIALQEQIGAPTP